MSVRPSSSSRASGLDCRFCGHDRNGASAGFTLIELLVALFIFAMLAGAGVLLLNNSVSAQAAIGQKLSGLADVERARGALAGDLLQATARISRTQNGLLAPAFFARPQGEGAPVLQFIRAGYDNLDDAPRSSLQKVEYWVRDGALERAAYPMIDGASAPEPAAVLDKVESATFRFRDQQGEWREDWTPTQPDLMPLAVEITLVRSAGPSPLVMTFLVGPGAKLKLEPGEQPDA